MLKAAPPPAPWLWLALASALAAGCATAEPQAIVALPPPPQRAPPAAIRLAWLPLETRASPELASAVNERLAKVEVAGVSEAFQASVSMEMAQLAIECIERTSACYGAVGQSVHADRLLWAELERGRHGALTLRLSLFDVASGSVVQKGARAFTSTRAARAGIAGLFEQTFGGGAAGGPP